jgi:hypothetical protein
MVPGTGCGKALLLARDHEIRNPLILEQLRS